jgi:hypothetical protein
MFSAISVVAALLGALALLGLAQRSERRRSAVLRA